MTHDSAPDRIKTALIRLAPWMSFLGLFNLFLWAGLIHRAQQDQATPHKIELLILEWGLFTLWPLFIIECVLAWWKRCPEISGWMAFWRCLLVLFVPPFRLAWIHPVTNQIWFPLMGWQSPGKSLAKRLERLFNGPMFVIALLILPVLIVENYMPDQLTAHPGLALALHIGTALIWVSFSSEFILKISASPRTLIYFKERWLDLVIVILPTLEFMLTNWVDASPLLRLLRIGRALGPQQISQMARVYRFRGVMMRGWQAFLLLEGVARLLGQTPEKRLKKIEEQLLDLQQQVLELEEEATKLREQLAAKAEPDLVELNCVPPESVTDPVLKGNFDR